MILVTWRCCGLQASVSAVAMAALRESDGVSRIFARDIENPPILRVHFFNVSYMCLGEAASTKSKVIDSLKEFHGAEYPARSGEFPETSSL